MDKQTTITALEKMAGFGGQMQMGGQLTPYGFPVGYSDQKAVKQYKSWIAGLVNLNCKAIAGVPLRMYAKVDLDDAPLFATKKLSPSVIKYFSGNFVDAMGKPHKPSHKFLALTDTGIAEMIEHPILTMLKSPNPQQTFFGFMIDLMKYLQLTGNAYIYVSLSPATGTPQYLSFLPSQLVTPFGGHGIVTHYKMRTRQGGDVTFPAEQVIHLVDSRDPEDRFRGQGPVESAWQAILLDQAKKAFESSFLKNNARPDLVVHVKTGNLDSVNRVEAQLNNRLQGVKNAGRAFVVGSTDDIAIETLNYNNNPLDTGSSKASSGNSPTLTEMALIFGIPMSKIINSEANKSTAATGEYNYTKDTVTPYLTNISSKLNQKLMPMYGIDDVAFLEFDNVVPRDRSQDQSEENSKVANLNKLADGGIISRNEARVELGMEPIDNPAFDIPVPSTGPIVNPEDTTDDRDDMTQPAGTEDPGVG